MTTLDLLKRLYKAKRAYEISLWWCNYTPIGFIVRMIMRTDRGLCMHFERLGKRHEVMPYLGRFCPFGRFAGFWFTTTGKKAVTDRLNLIEEAITYYESQRLNNEI